MTNQQPASTSAPAHGTAAQIDWMVFDLGGVVLSDTAALPDIARRIGAPPDMPFERFRAAYDAPRFEYDRASDTRAYWTAVAAGCRAPAPTETDIAELTAMDVDGWSTTDPATLELIDDLDTADVDLAVLSNAPAAMGEHVRGMPWATPFRHIVISGELGIVKPDPAIYASLLATLDAAPERVAFTDDRADNIAAAADAGIHAVRFTGANDLRRTLTDLGVRV